jgi:glycosyltransferase involved in cell wall biosynthesis
MDAHFISSSEMDKKILIVTYYWPPSGGSGVQRWLKFVKYLPSFGWTPFVAVPEKASYTLLDESLEKDVPPEAEVLRIPIWEPYHLFAGIKGKKHVVPDTFVSARKNFFQWVVAFLRGNLFVPDARICWVPTAVRCLEDIIRRNGITHVVTTGPPHSVHLIGLRLKKKMPSIRWLADFRDPWSQWDLLRQLNTMAPVKRLHRWLEKQVLNRSDVVVTVTPRLAAQFSTLGQRPVNCITNGYDEDDFRAVSYVRTDRFTIRHFGIARDPRPFMDAVRELCRTRPDFSQLVQVEFVGVVDPAFREWVERDSVLERITRFTGYLPHDRLPSYYCRTDVLLLLIPDVAIADVYLPGKLFEYLASRRPVLGIGPERSDAADVLEQTGGGCMADRHDGKRIQEVILHFFERWSKGEDLVTQGAPPYSRYNLTARLVELL